MSPRKTATNKPKPKRTANRLSSSQKASQKSPALKRLSHSEKSPAQKALPLQKKSSLQKASAQKTSPSQKASHPRKKSPPSKATVRRKIEDEPVEKNGSSTSISVETEKNAPASGIRGKSVAFAKVKDEVPKRERSPSAENEPLPKEVAPNGSKVAKVKSEKATNGSSKFVGAHVSIGGGLERAVTRAAELGARAFGLFLRSQRRWACEPLSRDAADRFRDACREHNFAPHQILPHGSYLLNCGSPDPEVLEKSRATLIDELKRCEMLGLVYYNFHPGSTCGAITAEECMDRIAESINLAHGETTYVIAVIENMCRQGHTIGGDFRELRGIVDRVKDKSRIGVCLDTCHAFAAGYDVSTREGFEEMMTDFDSIVGLPFLKAFHLNDSKGKLGSRLDRHENIGKGFIGPEGFRRIMNDPRLDHLPMILETPEMDYAKEIALLYGMCS